MKKVLCIVFTVLAIVFVILSLTLRTNNQISEMFFHLSVMSLLILFSAFFEKYYLIVVILGIYVSIIHHLFGRG